MLDLNTHQFYLALPSDQKYPPRTQIIKMYSTYNVWVGDNVTGKEVAHTIMTISIPCTILSAGRHTTFIRDVNGDVWEIFRGTPEEISHLIKKTP